MSAVDVALVAFAGVLYLAWGLVMFRLGRRVGFDDALRALRGEHSP